MKLFGYAMLVSWQGAVFVVPGYSKREEYFVAFYIEILWQLP